jgi:putative transposase
MPQLRHLHIENGINFITSCILERKNIFAIDRHARILMDAILYGRMEGWYYLFAFVIMPEHMHLELTPKEKTLAEIMKIIKGFSSRQINNTIGSSGSLWQAGYMDFPIFTKKVAWQKVVYIENNPVRAGLVKNAIDYPFSSAAMHDLLDLDMLT